MEVRDLQLVRRVEAGSFAGYARRDSVVERVVACVALLATMVMSGILLGRSPRR